MPVYALFAVRNEDYKIIKEAFYLDKFGFFVKIQIKNICRAIATDFSSQIKNGNDNYIEIEESLKTDKIIIATKKDNNKRIIAITDLEYNSSIRYKIIMTAMDITQNYDLLIQEYKDWTTKDLTSQIEKEIKAANDNVIKGLSAILDRGQSLNELVEKSENLSLQTKKLFKTAKKQNSCCST